MTIAVSGAYGKPRPALVVQADAFLTLPSVTVLQLTSDVQGEHLIRILVRPSAENGLHKPSQVMIDRAITVPRAKVGPVFGHLEPDTQVAVSRALQRFLELQGVPG